MLGSKGSADAITDVVGVGVGVVGNGGGRPTENRDVAAAVARGSIFPALMVMLLMLLMLVFCCIAMYLVLRKRKTPKK